MRYVEIYYNRELEPYAVMYVQWNHTSEDTIGTQKKCPFKWGVLLNEVKYNRKYTVGTEIKCPLK